jgi:hypothetical protein
MPSGFHSARLSLQPNRWVLSTKRSVTRYCYDFLSVSAFLHTLSSPYSELTTRNSLLLRVKFYPYAELLRFDEEFLCEPRMT